MSAVAEFVRFQAAIRQHISLLGFDDWEDDEIFHQKGILHLWFLFHFGFVAFFNASKTEF